MATVTRERFADNELCIEWFDAVAAIDGCPGAPPAEAIERLIACGDALAAALASQPAEDVPTHADWSVVDCQPDQNDVPPNEYRPVIVPVNGLGYTSVILRDCSITESLPSKSGAIVLRDSHRGDVVGLRFPGTFAQAPPASDPPGLPRYGVTWQEGVSSPLLTPMADGYWTPWHLAAQAIAARQSDPPGLVNLVKELADSLEVMLRHRHGQAHNGDVVMAGKYETCRLCEPARVLIEEARAYPLPASPQAETKGDE